MKGPFLPLAVTEYINISTAKLIPTLSDIGIGPRGACVRKEGLFNSLDQLTDLLMPRRWVSMVSLALLAKVSSVARLMHITN